MIGIVHIGMNPFARNTVTLTDPFAKIDQTTALTAKGPVFGLR